MNKLPPINTWNLIVEGIDGQLRGGFRKAIKHLDIDITDVEIDRICDSQANYLMHWFSETFLFNDEVDDQKENEDV